ncbi:MAG: Ig-like domain-containing protein, partial [Candidatus Caldipriscus sp.]
MTGRIGDNVLLVKTDTSGNVIWAKKFSGFSTSAEGISLRVLGDGIFIGGNSDNDLLTIKTNNSGMVPSCDYVTNVSLYTTSIPPSGSGVDTVSVSLTLLPTSLSLSVSTPFINTNTVCLDTTRPYVVSTVPANGATGVARNTDITVVFSERIDTSTVDTTSIRIVVRSLSHTFTKSCSPDSVCVLTPTSPFNYRDTVWVYFDTLITDLAGNRLIPDSIYFVIRDTTIDTTRPRIVLTRPDSGSIYVPLSANIGVWFSKHINDTTINASSVSITGWDGNSFRTYSFTKTCPMPNFCVLDPILNFRPNEEITVRFDSTIRDNSGNRLIPKVIVFRTQGVDTLNPVVVFTTPDSGAVDVPSNTKIAVQFSRDMDTTTINPTNVRIIGSSSGSHTFSKICRTLSYCEITPVPSFYNWDTVTVEFRSGI